MARALVSPDAAVRHPRRDGRTDAERSSYQGCPARRRRQGRRRSRGTRCSSATIPRLSAPRRVVTGSGRYRRRAPASRQLHRRIGPSDRAAGKSVPVDADRGYRRRPRRRPPADGGQRRTRPPITPGTTSDAAPIEVDASAEILHALAGQRRHGLDAGCSRVGLRGSTRKGSSPRISVRSAARHGWRCSSPQRSRRRRRSSPPIRSKDVAILLMNASVLASVRPVSLGCALPSKPPHRGRPEDFHLRQSSGRGQGHDSRKARATWKRMPQCPTSGSRSTTRAAPSLPPTAPWSASLRSWTRRIGTGADDSRVVRVGEVCEVIASAEKKLKDAAAAERNGSSG